jgi:hypothetical protein
MKSEHRGFKNRFTGIHGHFRNPRAHGTRFGSEGEKDDFYDALLSVLVRSPPS